MEFTSQTPSVRLSFSLIPLFFLVFANTSSAHPLCSQVLCCCFAVKPNFSLIYIYIKGIFLILSIAVLGFNIISYLDKLLFNSARGGFKKKVVITNEVTT